MIATAVERCNLDAVPRRLAHAIAAQMVLVDRRRAAGVQTMAELATLIDLSIAVNAFVFGLADDAMKARWA